MISVILAALAAWLLVSDLQVFAWPGRLALFLLIFAAIRWLVRFLWNLGRGGGPMGGGRWPHGLFPGHELKRYDHWQWTS